MPYISLNEIESRELVPGFQARFVHTDNITLSNWEVASGALLPEHTHPHEQLTQLLEGEFEFTLASETKKLTPGMIVVIPSNVPHSGLALTACRIVDIFYPVREEYR